MNFFLDKWEDSYKRGENFIFYPKEEVVKFLNRFVRKKVGFDTFIDILDFSKNVKGLDFGCGIGRQTILMREFGIDAYGVDISSEAILNAQQMARAFGYDIDEKFEVIEGVHIPHEDGFFDITVSESTLDSMPFELARTALAEIDRVTRKIVFLSLISGDTNQYFREFNDDVIIETQHEEGTVQSYYNWEKLKKLLFGTNFAIQWCHLVREEGMISHHEYGRYYLVLSKG